MICGYIFYFLGQLFSGQLFELFARETNLKKQSSVVSGELINKYHLCNHKYTLKFRALIAVCSVGGNFFQISIDV